MPTADEIRKSYKPKLRRAEVLAMGQGLGLSIYLLRRLLRDGHIKGQRYIGCVKAYYDRDQAIAAMISNRK